LPFFSRGMMTWR